MLVIIIEVAFYFTYDPLSSWLANNIGWEKRSWMISILFANVIILLEPCRRLAKFMGFALYIMERGRDHINSVDDDALRAPMVKEYFSTLSIGAAMTAVIVIIVPNGIEDYIHILVMLVVLALAVIHQLRKYRKEVNGDKKEEVPEPEG